MNFQFPQIISSRRKELQLTQEQVAQFIGVSRAAVSKWEQGQSYPDIVLLPKLAMYFNMSIDELLGYEPQLTAAAIEKIYAQLAKNFTEQPFEEVMGTVNSYVTEYYSCYPLLSKMVQLIVNHLTLAPDMQQPVERAIELCQRVKENTDDLHLVNEVTALESMCYIMLKKPNQVLALLGEEPKLQYGLEQMIVTAHHMLGNVDKAKSIMQVTYYQQFVGMINMAIESLMLEVDNPSYTAKTIARLEVLLDLYEVPDFHENTVFLFYLKSATVCLMQGNMEEAKRLLSGYMRYAIHLKFPLRLKGDTYFYLIDDWIEAQDYAMSNLPRDEKAIKADLINTLLNPMYSTLLEDPELHALFETMKHHLQKGEI